MSDTGSKKVKPSKKGGKKVSSKKPGSTEVDFWDDVIKYDKPPLSA